MTPTAALAVKVAAMRRPLLAASLLAGAAGCPVVEEPPPGVGGLDGVLAFEAPTELVFSENISVGSRFSVTARPLESGAVVLGDAADVGVSSDDVTVTVTGRSDDEITFEVVLDGPGVFRLAVSVDGEIVDRVNLTAVPPATTTLVDGTVLAFAGAIDAQVPASFSFLTERTLQVGVAAVDRCGNGILDLGASTVVVEEGSGVAVSPTELGGFELLAEAAAPASFDVTLQSPGLAPLTYRAKSVEAGAVDELRVNMVTADSAEGTFTAWSRPFADGAEVLGLEDITWAGNARIALTSSVGPLVDGVVDFAASEDPEYPTDAILTASGLGEEGSLNLLGLQTTDLVTSRAAPPTREGDDDDDDTPADTSVSCASCEDAPACDPLAALLPIWGLRRLRRRRHRR
jgi:hypothetical protein